MKSSVIMILFVASVGIRSISEHLLRYVGMSPANVTNVSMAAQYLTIILVGLVLTKRSSLRLDHVLGKVSCFKDTAMGLVIGVTLMMLTLGLNTLVVWSTSVFDVDLAYSYGGFHSGYYFVTMPWYAFVILCVSHFILAAAGEEWLFRGLLLRSMVKIYNPARSILIVSVAFGLLHYGKDMLGAFVFSVVLCVLYLRSGSLYQAVVAHCVYNVLAYVVTYKFEFYFERSTAHISSFSDWVPELTMLAVSASILIYVFVRGRTPGAFCTDRLADSGCSRRF